MKPHWNCPQLLMISLLLSLQPAQAARWGGKVLDHKQAKASLRWVGGLTYQGWIHFDHNRRAVFKNREGKENPLELHSSCARGLHFDLDSCWPEIKVTIEEGSALGYLKVLEKPRN